MGKKNLQRASKNKNDEFYTRSDDIERELKHYRDQGHFKNKVIYCNCDDPEYSNFWKYFKMNFTFFGLKKLIATHYNEGETSYKLEFDGVDVKRTDLVGDGDFRSEESIELLKESDIVVTNPPFSLFREYVAQLIAYDKSFIIIGNFNAVTYKEFFPLLKDNKVWTGQSPRSMDFKMPDGNLKTVNASWFTNLDIPKRHEDIILYEQYDPDKYPTYDNYDAINIDRVNQIPMDYDGVMGVPITFLDKYNPKQFELVKFRKGDDEKDLAINGKTPYFRILIRKIK